MAKRLHGWIAGMLALAAFPTMAAETVACHYTYGGESKVLRVRPVKSPYDVGTIQIGSYFRFRVVFQAAPADLGSIKIYTYSDREEGPVPIHQGTYAYPPAAGKTRYGFTGLNFVYEPSRDGEVQYWCELETDTKKKR